jgi:type IV secretory pathway VirB2 component (pilin)
MTYLQGVVLIRELIKKHKLAFTLLAAVVTFLSLTMLVQLTGSVVQYTAIIGSCIYGACVLFGDSLFYTSVLKYYQILLVICIVPGIAVLFYKLRSAKAKALEFVKKNPVPIGGFQDFESEKVYARKIHEIHK